MDFTPLLNPIGYLAPSSTQSYTDAEIKEKCEILPKLQTIITN